MLKFLSTALVVIAVLSTLLYIMPMRIAIKTIRREKDDFILIGVKTLYGILNLNFELPMLDIVFINNKPALKYKAEIESNKTNKLLKRISKIFTIDDFYNIKQYFHHDPVFMRRFLGYWQKKLFVYDFTFILKYGFHDAAFVALLYGVIWTFLGTALALLHNNLHFYTKDIIVKPNFDKETLGIEFSCIIKFKFGDIINTGIMLFQRRIQRRQAKNKLKDTLDVT